MEPEEKGKPCDATNNQKDSIVARPDEDHLRKGQDVSVLRSLVAGSVSGLVARTLTAPLDTVKIRLQLSAGSQPGRLLVYETVRTLVREEGLRALWKGNVAGSVMYVVYGGVQFGSYSVYNTWLAQYVDVRAQWHSLAVGAMAGMTSSLVSYPFDVLRTLFVADRGTAGSLRVLDTLCGIWRHEGVLGLYRASLSSVVSVSLSAGLTFGTYETIKVYCDENRDGGGIAAMLDHSASSISAAVAKTVTFPIDTVRRRVQAVVGCGVWRGNRSVLYHLLRHLMVHARGGGREVDGVFSLYRGLPLALCKSVPTTALSLWAYEGVMAM